MKRLYFWAIMCSVACGAIGLAVWLFTAVPPWNLNLKLASELAPSDPTYNKVMCGPVSLSVALGRLGVNMAPSEIASQCRVTSYGVALTDLERVAASIRTISATARILQWEDLQAVDGVAVLFVKGDHYVAADPRETSSKTAAIRIYDREVPARWYSRTELEKIWSGETLVITKQQTPSNMTNDPSIAWNECYIDKGVLADTTIAGFKFSLRNNGSKNLIIDSIQTSCGCIDHRLSQKEIAPGELTQVEVDVNLNGKEGYVQQYMVVKSNDPINPVSILKMACGVSKKQPVSTHTIRLKDLPQGSNVRQEFVVFDQEFAGIKIREAKFHLHDSAGLVTELVCLISWEMIGENAKEISKRMGFSVSPGDYLVQLTFKTSNACPPGPFEGNVVVIVEADDSVATHMVNIQGMIVQDVRSIPQLALITLGPDPESIGSATIQLHSSANRTITVVKMWTDSTHQLEIRPKKELQVGKNSFVVSARMPDLIAGAAPFKGTAMFELESGSIVSVPVTVFRPPHGVEKMTGRETVKASKE